jgi:hypothetical protein
MREDSDFNVQTVALFDYPSSSIDVCVQQTNDARAPCKDNPSQGEIQR